MWTWNLNPGDELHDLRIVRELGRGAYGRVYLAEDLGIGRLVALKVARAPAGSAERRRAQREARIVGRLKSPHLVTIHRVIEDPERELWLLVLEYASGGSLADVLEREPQLAVPRALELMHGIMTGLEAARQAGVVHGDVKPGNVLLDEDGSVKLADFGLSWMIDDTSISNTAEEGLGGTPAYMAPEVIMGERGRVQSDIWSAGVIFYRLLAGRLPFPTDSLHELFFSVQNASPPAFTESMPGSVQALVMSMLEKSPADRPQTPADVIRRLDELSGRPMPERVDLADVPAEPVVRAPAPRIFGREAESEALAHHLQTLAEGEGAAVLVAGEAGIGKSALVRQLTDAASAASTAVVEVAATPLEGVLRPLVAAARTSLRKVAGRTLDSVLSRLSREARESVLGHAEDASAAVGGDSMQRLAWGSEHFLREYGAMEPLVLVVEDLHVVEPEELRTFRELMRRLHGSRVLTVLTYRTHDVNTSASQSHSVAGYHDLTTIPGIHVLELGPLAPDAVLALLNAFFPGTFVAPEIAHQVVATAEGNPLFAGEILRHLEDVGAIRREGSSLRATQPSEVLEIPSRFQELVARRLAGVEEEQRTLLDAAAVDGRVFDGEAVAAMLERPLLGVLRDLQRLYRERHLVEPVGDQYRFTSTLAHAVIYDQIAPALRRAMHASLADYLEKREGEPEAERLGTHRERAGDAARARPHLMRAAREAAQRHLHRKALELAQRAGFAPDAIGPEDVAADGETLLHLGLTLVALSRPAEARAVFDALEAHAPGDRLRLRAAIEANFLRYQMEGAGAVDESVVDRVIALEDEPLLAVRGLRLRARIARFHDRLADAAEALDRAAELARREDATIERAQILLQRAGVAAASGAPEEAEALYDEAGAILESEGREANASVCAVNRALSRIERGELDDNVAPFRKAFRSFQLGGYESHAIETGCHLAELQYSLGDVAGSFATLAEMREIRGAAGAKHAAYERESTQARMLLMRGSVATAARHAEAAAELAGGWDRLAVTVAQHCFAARWRLLTGEEGAAECARHAFAAARDSDSARTRAYPAWELIDLVPLGLDASVFPRDETDPKLAILHECARAFADDAAPPDALERAVALFDEEPPPWRRAVLGLWRDACDAEARARRGENPEERYVAALERARSLQDVWWQAYYLRRLAGTSDYAQQLDRVVFDIAESCDDPSQKRRIVQHWAVS